MATKESTQAAPAASVKQSPAKAKSLPRGRTTKESAPLADATAGETVLVPVMSQPYAKAPAADPYLKPDTVTAEHLTVAGYALPPILRGVQPGKGFRGEPEDYSVKVIWIARRQIDAMLNAIEAEKPEMRQPFEIIRAFMCTLDTIRDEAKMGVLAARSCVKPDTPKGVSYRENLNGVAQQLGRWNDERRLHLR